MTLHNQENKNFSSKIKTITLFPLVQEFRGDIMSEITTTKDLTHAHVWDLMLEALQKEHREMFKLGQLVFEARRVGNQIETLIYHTGYGFLGATPAKVIMENTLTVNPVVFEKGHSNEIVIECRRHGVEASVIEFLGNNECTVTDLTGKKWKYQVRLDHSAVLTTTP